MLEVDFGALVSQFRRVRAIPASGALILAAIALPLAGAALHLSPQAQSVLPARDPLVLFPDQVGAWRGGNPQLLDRDVEQVLKADDYLLADYVRTAGEPGVNLFVAYYGALNQGDRALHSPEECLPGGGWEVSRWSTVDTGVATPSGQTLSVNRAEMQKGLDRELVYYWLVERGKPMTNWYAAKVSTFVNSLTLGRSDGALVRVITPIRPGEGVGPADDRLRGFLTEALGKLPRFLPQ